MGKWLRFLKSGKAIVALFAIVVASVVACVVGSWQFSHYSCRRSIVDLNHDRVTEARDRLKIAIRTWPWNDDAQFWAARAARVNGDLSAAEVHLTRCLKLNGGATERVQLEFLLLRAQAGEIEEMASILFGLIQQEGGHPEALAILKTLGKVYMQRLRLRPAYACMSKWIELAPDDPTPYHYRGWVNERLSNSKLAQEDFLKSLELDPEQIEVRLRVVELYLNEKKALEALPHVERLYQMIPNDPRVQARLGMCLSFMGQERARSLMEAAEPHLPDDASLLVAMANFDLQDNRPLDAERRLRKILAIDPSDTEAMFVLATALQLQGRTEESETVRTSCIEKRAKVDRIHELLKDTADTPNASVNINIEIGDLFLQIDRDKHGVYWVEQALERDPTNQRAHRILTAYYEKKGDLENAARHRRQLRSTSTGP